MRLLPVLSLAFLGCQQPGAADRRGPGAGEEPEDNFGAPDALRILAPLSGETLEAHVLVKWESGRNVKLAGVEIDGEPVGDFVDAITTHELGIEVPSGRHTISVVGYDADRGELAYDDVTVRIVDDPSDGWVSITSPIDGSHPVNPVTFTVDGSDQIETIEILADDWTLGRTVPGGVLTYEFGGTGFPRGIEARGYDGEGNLLATDDITITVEATEAPPPDDFNDLVVPLMSQYSSSDIQYWWPDDVEWSGSTRDIWYQDVLVADDGDDFKSCFCVGLTWEIYLRAWQEWDLSTGGTGDDLNGLTPEEVLDMRVDWFVRELDGPGASYAFERWGLGEEVLSFDDFRPGDFVQFWRLSGSGHNVIFTGWVTDGDGNKIGMEYWSCNGTSSTDGPGYNTEYFGTHSSAIDPELVYNGRGFMPSEWY